MKITILAVGSRGDVQPLIALGGGLRRAGFEVQCATHSDFKDVVEEESMTFFELAGSSGKFFGGAAGIAMRSKMRNPKEFVRFHENYLGFFMERLMKKCWEATQGSDCVLCWSWTRFGPSLAEALKVPVFIVSPNPVLHLPTATYANPFQGPGPLPLGWLYNRLTWFYGRRLLRLAEERVQNWRVNTLGLPPIRWQDEIKTLRKMPHLFGMSTRVLPRPWDWGKHIHVTGYWFLDRQSQYTPPADLAAFLENNEAPIAVGFSSQIGKNSRELTQIVIDALAKSGKPGILIAGFGGLNNMSLPANVFSIPSVPYDWLFPKIAAMVHHGGAGSTAAALRAGVPSFAVPFGYEQALWGHQIAKLKVGLPPMPPETITVDRLAKAFQKIAEDPQIRSRAQRLGAELRKERGIDEAVAIVNETLRPGTPLPVETLQMAS